MRWRDPRTVSETRTEEDTHTETETSWNGEAHRTNVTREGSRETEKRDRKPRGLGWAGLGCQKL